MTSVQIEKGVPTVLHLSDSLNVSANYLSRLLKILTGKTTQQHIHYKLIDVAKIKYQHLIHQDYP